MSTHHDSAGDCAARSMRLGDLSWPAVSSTWLLAVPVGSTEQHGPHLPLSTDTDIAIAVCDRLARVRADVIVAPAVAYGSSGEHAGFPGTLSIGRRALELLLVELARSATETFARVVFVNGHGGNADALRRAARTLVREGRDVLAWSPAANGDAHAGWTETSLQLAIDPTRVVATAAEAGEVGQLAALLPALRAGRLREITPNGVLGDPAGASAADGRALLDAMSMGLAGAVVARWPQ